MYGLLIVLIRLTLSLLPLRLQPAFLDVVPGSYASVVEHVQMRCLVQHIHARESRFAIALSGCLRIRRTPTFVRLTYSHALRLSSYSGIKVLIRNTLRHVYVLTFYYIFCYFQQAFFITMNHIPKLIFLGRFKLSEQTHRPQVLNAFNKRTRQSQRQRGW